MNYQVLARKWRPKNFQSLAGQEHVLRPLIHALQQQRLHHAYLFTGTRGVGKTTIARIFAKCLNCEKGVSNTPCGNCTTCIEIDEGRFVDLIEVDAASRTKVEDTRELLDNVQYAPTRGRYKVYLIDEVHMLSGHSFNALLKTLEEPPAHVKFLLATTDPQKLPITVLSRCLQFNLKSLSVECIATHLQKILEAEQISFDLSAILPLARTAKGSMRDALSLLDQGIAYCQGQLNAADIHSMLGTISSEHIQNLLAALAQQNGKLILDTIAELADYAPDYDQILEEVLSLLQSIAVTQLVPEAARFGADTPLKIDELSKSFTKEEVQLYYQIALTGRRDLPLAPSPRSGLEMLMLRMLAFQPASNQVLEETAPALNSSVNKKPTHAVATSKVETSPVAKPVTASLPVIEAAKMVTPATANHSSPAISIEDSISWNELFPKLQLTGLAHVLASNCALKEYTQNHMQLVISSQHSALVSEQSKARLLQALTQYFAKPIKLSIQTAEVTQETPAATQQRVANEQHAAAIKAIESDNTIQALIDKFGATIHPDLVEAV